MLAIRRSEVYTGKRERHYFESSSTSVSKKTSALTSDITDVLFEIQREGISQPNYIAVRNYLLTNFDIIDIVQNACRIAKERMGNNASLSLELYNDPENHEKYLTLYIRQEKYEENILKSIEEISAEFEDELAGKSGWLLVTTDFNPPTI